MVIARHHTARLRPRSKFVAALRFGNQSTDKAAKRREKGRRLEVLEERATATYGKEKEGETEVNVPEEEGAAQVAMEMEE